MKNVIKLVLVILFIVFCTTVLVITNNIEIRYSFSKQNNSTVYINRWHEIEVETSFGDKHLEFCSGKYFQMSINKRLYGAVPSDYENCAYTIAIIPVWGTHKVSSVFGSFSLTEADKYEITHVLTKNMLSDLFVFFTICIVLYAGSKMINYSKAMK